MRRTLCLTLAVLLVAPALLAQPKKVVLTTRGSWYFPLGPAEMAEFRAAAPGVNLVAPEPAQVMAELADADAIIGSITPEMFRAAKKLKWVQVGSAGVENFLFPEMKSSSVVLTNCKIVQGPEIADHAFALLLSLTRQLNRSI